jgi:hypothetical protein
MHEICKIADRECGVVTNLTISIPFVASVAAVAGLGCHECRLGKPHILLSIICCNYVQMVYSGAAVVVLFVQEDLGPWF